MNMCILHMLHLAHVFEFGKVWTEGYRSKLASSEVALVDVDCAGIYIYMWLRTTSGPVGIRKFGLV